MEQVEAELAGWPPAPYPNKADVDASFKRCSTTRSTRPPAATCGSASASHNLFDVAWALTLRAERGLQRARSRSRCSRGWRPPRPRAARDDAGGLLLYTPVVAADDFAASIAYLSRRLDENAGAGELPAVAVLDHARVAGVAARSSARFETAVAAPP